MSLSQIAIQRKVTVVMVTLGIILIGIIAFLRLPQELFPPIQFPQVTIVTDYTNAAPEEIESLITKPIEEAVGSVAGLKRIESISREGRSTIIVSFNWGQDIDFAALAVREKIDLIKERLPKEADDPVVLKFDPLSRPILIVSVTGNQIDPVRLKILTEKMIKDNLEKIEGIASVTISGGINREIQVEIDQARLHASHLSILQVIEAIEDTNVSYPAGSIKKGLYEYLIRTVGEFRNVKEIEYTVAGIDTVKKIHKEDTSFLEQSGETGPRDTLDSLRQEVKRQLLEKRLVLVRDIAEVIDGTAERTSLSRYNGQENVALSIQKQANSNTIEAVQNVRKALKVMKEDLNSRGLEYNIIYDHSVFIQSSLQNLLKELLTGAFFAFIVLYLFLRSFSASLLVTISIPISILGVFFMMSLFNISLNIMSLGGLSLSIGMIVDTSIVVLENIVRRRQLGESPEEAAQRGSEEMTWPVIASNLTTVAVFFPLLIFVPGIMGQVIKDLSWTIIYSQIVSTFIPLTLIAMLSVPLKIKLSEYKPRAWTSFLSKRLNSNVSGPRQERFVFKSVVIIFLGILGVILWVFPTLEREILPKVDQGQFLIKVDMPIGTRLEVTDRVAKKIEEAVHRIEEVKDIAITVGSEKSRQGEVSIETLRPSQGIILVTLHSKRKHASSHIVQTIRDKMSEMDLEEAKVEFIIQESEFQFAAGGVKPILIEVKGYNLDQMKTLTDSLKKKLKTIPGVIEIRDDIAEPTLETKLDIDKKRSALYAISAMDISLTAKAAIEGVVATEYREEGKEFDVRVRLSAKDRANIENLQDMLLFSQAMDQLIPLKEIAAVTKGLGPSEIRRINQERTTIISADIHKDFQTKDILREVQKMLRQTEVPLDFHVVLSGQAREMKESYVLLIFAFILAVVLNYMIMASLFESFLQPLIIMFTVPLAFVGIVLSLWVTGISINLISILGVIILVGVVVNNGIVLIEYTNQLRMEGYDVAEAALESAKVRTRPILMSVFTSIVALLPVMIGFGEGSELMRPMAVAVFGGLLSSTVLTLIVIPLLYIGTAYMSARLFSFEDDFDLAEEKT